MTTEEKMVEMYRHHLECWKEKQAAMVEEPTDRTVEFFKKARMRALEDSAILIDVFGWDEAQTWKLRKEYGI